ncbi:hypothetical protein OK016_05240 [Vibrio chagasii]|nr:hypothetical protein [Vibrio chagasii]
MFVNFTVRKDSRTPYSGEPRHRGVSIPSERNTAQLEAFTKQQCDSTECGKSLV